MRFPVRPIASVVALSMFGGMGARGSGTWTTGENIAIPANIVTAGNSAVYEALVTAQNQGQLEFRDGARGALIAGERLELKPGFKAEAGATLWGMIDGNFNGISDHLESLDRDGDGYFDALEAVLGTSPTLDSTTFARDFDGDSRLDVVEDVIHGGTPSAYLPSGSYPGYQGRLAAGYAAFGSFYSVAVSGGLVGGLLPSLSEYFDFNFDVVYTFFSLAGWAHGISFPTEAGARYVVYCTAPNGQWVPCSNVILGDGQVWSGYSPLYDYLWQIPQFVTLVRLGEPSALIGSPQSVNLFNSGGEYIHEVKPEVKELEEEQEGAATYEVELAYENAVTSGGVVPIMYPKGATPSLANVRILGVEVGVTGSGTLTISFPGGLFGKLENWTFALIYYQSTPLRVDITGHRPGPDGAAIAEALEQNPANLVLPVNDNFDERLRFNGVLREDLSDTKIDLGTDADFVKLHLSVAPGLSQGVLAVKFIDTQGNEQDPVFSPFRFYPASGNGRLAGADLVIDLATPANPSALTGINTQAGVTLLIEAVEGRAGAVLALTYTLNDSKISDRLHLHAVDVDFLETSGPGALDDDDENLVNPQRHAMMVPLSAGEQSSGSGEVRVKVTPSSLAGNLELAWAAPGAPSTFSAVTLTGDQTVIIGGNQHSFLSPPLHVQWLPNGQIVGGLNVDFVARRPRDPTQKLKVALWRIGLTGASLPAEPYSAAAVLGFLNETWSKQANVHFEIIGGGWQAAAVAYDLNGDGVLTLQSSNAEVEKILNDASAPGTDVAVYVVQKMPEAAGAQLPGTVGTYLAIQAVGGGTSSLTVLAQEVGHVLGVPEEPDGLLSGDVISDPPSFGASNIRKVDWRAANPEGLLP